MGLHQFHEILEQATINIMRLIRQLVVYTYSILIRRLARQDEHVLALEERNL